MLGLDRCAQDSVFAGISEKITEIGKKNSTEEVARHYDVSVG